MNNQQYIDHLATINAALRAPNDSATGSMVAFFHYQERETRDAIQRVIRKITASATSLDSAVSISSLDTDWIASMSATAMLAWGIVDALAIREIPLATVQANLTKSVLALSRIQTRTNAENLDLTAKSEALYQIDQAIQTAAYNAAQAVQA